MLIPSSSKAFRADPTSEMIGQLCADNCGSICHRKSAQTCQFLLDSVYHVYKAVYVSWVDDAGSVQHTQLNKDSVQY